MFFIRTAAFIALALPVAACSSSNNDDTSGTPLGSRTINVSLSYMGGESNFGPKEATGTAVINTETGQVDIAVQGLPPYPDDDFEGWLAGGGETALSTGKFDTGADGTGSSSETLGNISSTTFTKVVLTVEPKDDPTPKPDSRHSIAGIIPPM